MIIAGIDPGLRRIGYALVRVGDTFPRILVAGSLTTLPIEGLETRWCKIWEQLDVLKGAEALGIEDQRDVIVGATHRRETSADSLRSLECVGLARAWALSRGLPVMIVLPKEAKLAVLGPKGSRGSKDQVRHATHAICKGQFVVDEHAADAVAVALAAGKRFHWSTVSKPSA